MPRCILAVVIASESTGTPLTLKLCRFPADPVTPVLNAIAGLKCTLIPPQSDTGATGFNRVEADLCQRSRGDPELNERDDSLGRCSKVHTQSQIDMPEAVIPIDGVVAHSTQLPVESESRREAIAECHAESRAKTRPVAVPKGYAVALVAKPMY